MRSTLTLILATATLALPIHAGAAASGSVDKSGHLSGYAFDAMWEVMVQNLTCEEINRLRFLQSNGTNRDPSLAQIMNEIQSDPAHLSDSGDDLFSPVMRSWSQTAASGGSVYISAGSPGFSVRPQRPGELKMLGYLDLAASNRNCPRN